ncbi:hypothetical protein KGF56_004320 [Candida oxycetoniae]|uniref:TATA element modulatory factor 1 TATA binding domain-containing protein n=1 Tax=Candida oxycetoniae TaxID=497107 RepID=A0AAI9WWK9_9ASCO|nr:uncharacterized protein KGF56_004320 [Candida oxycetoniae]KAI3402859.2 hypothetical protein KGF56_004320 [Candida oxycetoniae]
MTSNSQGVKLDLDIDVDATTSKAEESTKNDDDTIEQSEILEHTGKMQEAGEDKMYESLKDLGNGANAMTKEMLPVKKRLTLQERLALAAKGKKRVASEKGAKEFIATSPSSVSSQVSSDVSTSNQEPVDDEDGDELEKLRTENTKLKNQLKKNKPFDEDKNKFLATIAAKDDTIQQLLKEGEVLSHKELKLNETIKKLKSANQALEEDLANFSKKHDESLVKQEELQDFLRTKKFKTVEMFISKYAELNDKLKNLKEENESLKLTKIKYSELLASHEETKLAKQDTEKSLANLKIEFDMKKEQNRLEIASKEKKIMSIKNDLVLAKQNYSQEVTRLEEKIEQLRLDAEIDNHNSTTQKDTKDLVNFEDFKKLSDAHHLQQKQYLSAQENWNIKESNLLLKVETLKSSLESAKMTKTKLSNDIAKATKTIQTQMTESLKLKDQIKQHISKINDLELALESKDSSIQELDEKLEKLKSVYNQERINLNLKISNLTEVIEKSNEQKHPEPLRLDTKSNRDNLSNANLSWNDIRLGESSTTPALNKEYSIFFNNSSHNHSSASFTEIGDDMYDREQSSYSSQVGVGVGGGGVVVGGGTGESSLNFGVPTSNQNNNNNLHLVNKMSSNIRRLEIELHTLKDEYSKLLDEKEAREQELLNAMKINEQVNSLTLKIKELEETIEEKNEKEKTMLELIGEKSEQVSELQADVMDLKEICRSQVQQMIELQGL